VRVGAAGVQGGVDGPLPLPTSAAQLQQPGLLSPPPQH
jgi:hypothetical protein